MFFVTVRSLTRHGTTMSSSSHKSNSQPWHAVDGSTNPKWFHGSCFSTSNTDMAPWWMAVLPQRAYIGKVAVYNRAGPTCKGRGDSTDKMTIQALVQGKAGQNGLLGQNGHPQ